jgi:hypothetical protein
MDEQLNGSFQDTITKMRKRLLDAKRLSVGQENPQDYTLGVLTALMAECEKQRQACLQQVQSHREQAKAAEYQASAFASMHTMSFVVYDQFIRAEERSVEEQKARDAEKAEHAPKKKRPKNGA